MVAVEGRMFQKQFPASARLSYSFIWDKTDAYSQKVYGLAEAVGEQWNNGMKQIYIKPSVYEYIINLVWFKPGDY